MYQDPEESVWACSGGLVCTADYSDGDNGMGVYTASDGSYSFEIKPAPVTTVASMRYSSIPSSPSSRIQLLLVSENSVPEIVWTGSILSVIVIVTSLEWSSDSPKLSVAVMVMLYVSLT